MISDIEDRKGVVYVYRCERLYRARVSNNKRERKRKKRKKSEERRKKNNEYIRNRKYKEYIRKKLKEGKELLTENRNKRERTKNNINKEGSKDRTL